MQVNSTHRNIELLQLFQVNWINIDCVKNCISFYTNLGAYGWVTQQHLGHEVKLKINYNQNNYKYIGLMNILRFNVPPFRYFTCYFPSLRMPDLDPVSVTFPGTLREFPGITRNSLGSLTFSPSQKEHCKSNMIPSCRWPCCCILRIIFLHPRYTNNMG